MYAGEAADFPNGTPVTTDNLIDAVVYGTGDSDDPELAVLLADGAPQLDEDVNGNKDNESLQRSPDSSGTGRDTSTFVAAAPTPNAATGSTPSTGMPDNGDGIPDNALTGLRIYDIQGAGHLSPQRGNAVAGVPGVVTAVTRNSFYLQDPTATVRMPPAMRSWCSPVANPRGATVRRSRWATWWKSPAR